MAPAAVLTVFMVGGLVLPLGLVLAELAAEPERLGQVVGESAAAAGRSVLLAVVVAAIALPPAITVARSLTRARHAVRVVGVALCVLPLVLNLLVVILAWMVVLEREGLVNTLWTTMALPGDPPQILYTRSAAVLAMAYVVMPVMALILLDSFRRIDPRMREAARLLGARPLTRFVLVELGFVAPALVTAYVMGYVLCLNLYLVPEYLTGPHLTTLGFLVQENVIKSFDLGSAAVQATMLFVMAVLPVCGALAMDRGVRQR
ncbi:ABC transporter permease [Micromonospora sp. C95]|uniref:ABC transporter permease n=1 Tax=Micromonospora sp. C95 TaxID=2824882 RepID=UPI001B38577F|nr:ABC transporter permease subunit [Micromonospora sp. C95]